jgi:hypothetical protein
MRIPRLGLPLLLIITLFGSEARAQDWEVEVGSALGRYRVIPGRGLQPGDPLPAGEPITLLVRCTGDVDCRAVYVLDSIGNREMRGNWRPAASPERDRALFTGGTRYLLENSDAEKRLVFEFGGIPVGGAPIVTRTARVTTDRVVRRGDPPATSLAGNPIEPCRESYGTSDDHAVIVASAPGNVLLSTAREIDELDSVTVYVRSAPDVLAHLRIRRTSTIRGTTAFSVAGSGTSIPTFPLDAMARSREEEEAEGCWETHAVVRDFAPGAGVIGIEYLQGTGGEYKASAVSSLEVPVLPMHHAGLSLGVVSTSLRDPTYQLVGTDSVVTRTAGGRRYLYSVLLTPFILGRRNVERSADEWYQHVSPTFGVVLNHIQDNALVGVTVDMPAGTYFTYGWHFGRVTRLSDNGPREGDKLKGTGQVIATHRSWRSQNFVSFTVDLRAAAALLKAATRT